jgi:hypothetical protein
MPIEMDEAPPFLGTWKRVYTAVLLYCALLIGGLYLLTRWFRA